MSPNSKLANSDRHLAGFGLITIQPKYYGITMTTLTFKLSAEDAQKVRRAARLKRMTLSDYLRRAAVPASPVAKGKSVGRAGRVVIATPRLNKDIIDAALHE